MESLWTRENIVLAIDPSGNYKEGKGTTGWVLYDLKKEALINFGRIKADNYQSRETYWEDVVGLLATYKPAHLIVEGYRLYNHEGMDARVQSNSEMETSQLIGALKIYNHLFLGSRYYEPYAKDIKGKFDDKVLVALGQLEKVGNRHLLNGKPSVVHERDAYRHLLRWLKYTYPKIKEE